MANYYELTPAYGRDYTSRAAIVHAFCSGLDFNVDYQLGFQLVSIADFKPGDTVNLRYRANRMVAVYLVQNGVTA